jgi:6-pyruvoyltetrahydropterin/6-carboxytetrahydropterin synthase
MFYVTKRFSFDGAHQLPAHAGKCANLHGHTWQIDVTLKAGHLQEAGPSQGMVMDFGDIKAAMSPILEQLDHQFLNDTLPLPTCERLAMWVHEQLATQSIPLAEVTVYETPTSWCRYCPGE